MIKSFTAYLSAGLAIGLLSVYSVRPDWATALTILPTWAWLCIWTLSLPSYKSRTFYIATFLWLLFTFLNVEEIPSILRGWSSIPETKSDLKVVTINCSGNIEPIQETLLELPDVILTQESPSQKRIAECLAGSSYTFVHGMDVSIIVKGEILASERNRFFTTGIATIRGKKLFIASVRLATSNPRIDFWNPECWTSQYQMRKLQIQQILEIRKILPQEMPIILGGDFNVPQGDRVFQEIDPLLHDSFKNCGRGWCNTITRDLPLLRIDQVWISPDLISSDSFVRNCPHTDHKMYLTCLKYKQPEH